MKIMIFVLFLTIANFSVATVAQQNSMAQKIDAFVEKKLSATDQKEVEAMIQFLLEEELRDPSRTSAQVLAASYNDYPKIWDRAFLAVAKKKNAADKRRLKQIRNSMRDDGQIGNG